MRRLAVVVALFAPLLLGCPGQPPPSTATGPPAALGSEHQALRAALLRPASEAWILDLRAHDGQVWTYPDGPPPDPREKKLDHIAERPDPAIARRKLDDAARQRLAELVRPEHVSAGKGEFLEYAFVLEILAGGKAVARLDVHAKGGDGGCLFLIDPSLPEGSEMLAFTSEAGKSTWLTALEEAWNAAPK